MAFNKVNYIDGVTPIGAKNLNDIQDAVLGTKTANGTVVSQNADFAEVAEWADGNPNNEDRTGYFVCANVPVNGIVMKKATSTDDVKGVSIQAPAFAGNYTPDKLDGEGNLLPRYSFVAIIGFVPVIDNGSCIVGDRCMPDDNGCAIPSSNNMGYQVVNRIDENRVLIIIEPNGDMVQRIKADMDNIQANLDSAVSSASYFAGLAEGYAESASASADTATENAEASNAYMGTAIEHSAKAEAAADRAEAAADRAEAASGGGASIQWELLETQTLEASTVEAKLKLSSIKDYRGARVKLIIPSGTALVSGVPNVKATLPSSRSLLTRINYVNSFTTSAPTFFCFDILPKEGVWSFEVFPYSGILGTTTGDIRVDIVEGKVDRIEYAIVSGSTNNPLPEGTVIEYWGLK